MTELKASRTDFIHLKLLVLFTELKAEKDGKLLDTNNGTNQIMLQSLSFFFFFFLPI
jgi:hypothetical protein